MGQNFEEVRESADILIVGGGIAGLTAAVAAKEKNPDAEIIVVEKQTAGYGGKANKGGGVLQYFDLERTKPEEFLQYHVHAVGCYLGDQEVMKKYVAMNNEMIDRLDGWGVVVPKVKIPTGPMTFMFGIDLDSTLKMAAKARKMGVKIFDKVPVSDLLTDNGKIAGAVGYSIIDGTFYVFKAKAVIMATGSQNYRVSEMWSSGRGDGIAAAYRAGAEMRNTEFGNFGQLFRKESLHEVVFGENNMYNRLGENVTKNFRRFPEADISATALREWYDQMSQGKGPIYLHQPPRPDDGGFDAIWPRPYGKPFWNEQRREEEGKDADMEVIPGLVGEQSPVRVNIKMETTVEGLYAAGDVCYCGSGAPGAVPAPPGRNRGSGILNAVFAGIVSGESAAEYVKDAGERTLNDEQIAKLKEDAYAPLNRAEGIDPVDVIDLIQDVMCPVENSIIMSQHRLDICMRKIAKAKEMVKELKADDLHGMLSCHEAEAMVLCCEMQMRASMMRKESRGWFLREDYPVMDNDNWLKWIIVKDEGGEMTLHTEDVPIDQYEVQPLKF